MHLVKRCTGLSINSRHGAPGNQKLGNPHILQVHPFGAQNRKTRQIRKRAQNLSKRKPGLPKNAGFLQVFKCTVHLVKRCMGLSIDSGHGALGNPKLGNPHILQVYPFGAQNRKTRHIRKRAENLSHRKPGPTKNAGHLQILNAHCIP